MVFVCRKNEWGIRRDCDSSVMENRLGIKTHFNLLSKEFNIDLTCWVESSSAVDDFGNGSKETA